MNSILRKLLQDTNLGKNITQCSNALNRKIRKKTFSIDVAKPKIIPGPSSHSMPVLKNCIPIIYGRPSTVPGYPKSIFQLMMFSISSIDNFFSENRPRILGFDSHDLWSHRNCHIGQFITMKNKL